MERVSCQRGTMIQLREGGSRAEPSASGVALLIQSRVDGTDPSLSPQSRRLLVTIMEVTSWHVPGQTRGPLTIKAHTSCVIAAHIHDAFNLARCPDSRGVSGESEPDVLGSHTV